MAGSNNVFPAFVKAQYDSSGRGFAEFINAGKSAADQVQRHVKGSLDEIAKLTARALQMPKNSSGALDLGVGEFRQAAAAAEKRAAALRQVAAAVDRLAAKEGQLSGAMQVQVQATNAAAIAAEREAQTARERVTIYDQLQRELNETARAAGGAANANRALSLSQGMGAASAKNHQFAMIGVSQQLQDVIVGFSSGQRAGTIFAQQLPQLAFAMQGFGGAAGAVGRFLAGGWGVAVFGAATALGFLTDALGSSKSATEEATTAADGLSQAQSVLGEMFDLTSGKLEHQNELLRLNAQLTAYNLKAEAEVARARAQTGVDDAGISTLERLATIVSRVPGRAGASTAQTAAGRVQDLIRGVMSGAVPADKAFDAAGKGDLGVIGLSQQDFNKAISSAVEARFKSRTSDEILKTLRTGSLSPVFRRGGRTPKARTAPDHSREIGSLGESGNDYLDKVANVAGRFAGQPRLIEQARKANAELDNVARDLTRNNARMVALTGHGIANFDEVMSRIKEARGTIEEGLSRPLDDLLQQQDEQLQVQRLITAGRVDEAEALQLTFGLQKQLGNAALDHKDVVLANVKAIREEAQRTEIAQRKTQAYVSALNETRSNLQQAIEALPEQGIKSITDFAAGLSSTFNRLSSELITQKLFDPLFRGIEKMVKGESPLEKAEKDVADGFGIVATAATNVADALDYVATRIGGDGFNPVPTGKLDGLLKGVEGFEKLLADEAARPGASQGGEGQELEVTGPSRRRGFNEGPAAYLNRITSGTLGKLGEAIAGPGGKKLGEAIGSRVGTALKGAAIGGTASSILFGSRGSGTGAAVGGALGKVLGKEVEKTFGKQLGKLASFAGPVGSILGGLAGGAIGKLLTGSKKGVSTLSVGSDGSLKVSAATGNSARMRAAAGGAADSALTTVERIAEALGATTTGSGSVSIGMRDGKYRVDPTGRGKTKKKNGAIDFGEDAEAAVRYATMDLIRDGILGGLRASTQRLLQGSKDIDTALDKATRFESVFTRLKQHLDPVGAAVDTVNREFESLKRIFQEAGASAEEYAKLEQLYGLERAKAIEAAGESTVSALKELLDDLRTGDNGLSLRDRLAAAQAKYDPLAAAIHSGQAVDYQAFAEAARNVLDIQRQISGSQGDYFALYDEIVALTTKGLGASPTGVPGADLPSPFGPIPGAAPGVTGGDATVGAIEGLGDHLGGILGGTIAGKLDAITAAIIRTGGSSDGGYSNHLYSMERSNF